MEKENKKFREDVVCEFNDVVCFFIIFVWKCDFWYILNS